jgi:hypothetical protein
MEGVFMKESMEMNKDWNDMVQSMTAEEKLWLEQVRIINTIRLKEIIETNAPETEAEPKDFVITREYSDALTGNGFMKLYFAMNKEPAGALMNSESAEKFLRLFHCGKIKKADRERIINNGKITYELRKKRNEERHQ